MKYIAFYYTWYNGSDWGQPTPSLGTYSSGDPLIAEEHIKMAKRGAIDAFAISWWGKERPSAKHLNNGFLKAKNINDIKFTLLYEGLGPGEENSIWGKEVQKKVIADFKVMQKDYFKHSSYLHVDDRPVVCIYVTRRLNFPASFLERIKDELNQDILIIADEAYFGLQQNPFSAENGIRANGPVFEAYMAYNMYQFGRVKNGETSKDFMLREALPIYRNWSREVPFFPHVLTRMKFTEPHRAGFDHPVSGDVEDFRRQLEAFSQLPKIGEFPKFLFLTTFNEWREGSSIEPDDSGYGFSFLDMLYNFKNDR